LLLQDICLKYISLKRFMPHMYLLNNWTSELCNLYHAIVLCSAENSKYLILCLYMFFFFYIFLHPTFLSVAWCVVGVQSNRHQCVIHCIKNSYMEKFLVIIHSNMSAVCFTSDECSRSQKVIKWHLNVLLFCFLILWWWMTVQACENWCFGTLNMSCELKTFLVWHSFLFLYYQHTELDMAFVSLRDFRLPLWCQRPPLFREVTLHVLVVIC
jgi:hypothetical protein